MYVVGSKVLNESIIELKGSEVGFYVHYWGGTDVHYDNHVHKHSFFEVCYVVDGAGFYLEDGKQFPLEQGTLFCSRPHIKHQIRSKDGLGLIFVAFEVIDSQSQPSGRLLFERIAKTSTFVMPGASETPTMVIWKALLLESIGSKSLFMDRVKGLGQALLSSFQTTFSDTEAPIDKSIPRATGTLVYQAKLFIRDNLGSELKLHDVSNHLHVSDRHLSRIFQDELGQSFTHYVRKERIQKSAQLLSSTDLAIKDVAAETGFLNVFYFTKVFTSEMGIPPGHFRRQLGNE